MRSTGILIALLLVAAIAFAAIPPAGGYTKFPEGSTMNQWVPVSFSEDPTQTFTDDDGLEYAYNAASDRYERMNSMMIWPTDGSEPYMLVTVVWFKFEDPDPPIEGNPHSFTDYEEGVTMSKDTDLDGAADVVTRTVTDTGQVVSD